MNTKVILVFSRRVNFTHGYTVDYILFLTKDVTVEANANEVRDYKYVSKEELIQMFEDTSKFLDFTIQLTLMLSPQASTLPHGLN